MMETGVAQPQAQGPAAGAPEQQQQAPVSAAAAAPAQPGLGGPLSGADATLAALDMFNNVLGSELPNMLGGMLGQMELQHWRNSFGELTDLSRLSRATDLGFSNISRLLLGMRGTAKYVLISIQRADGGRLQGGLEPDPHDKASWEAILQRLEGSSKHAHVAAAGALRANLAENKGVRANRWRVMKAYASLLFEAERQPCDIEVIREGTFDYGQPSGVRLELWLNKHWKGNLPWMFFDGWLQRCAAVLAPLLGDQQLDIALFDLDEVGMSLVDILDRCPVGEFHQTASLIEESGWKGDYLAARRYYLSLPTALRQRLDFFPDSALARDVFHAPPESDGVDEDFDSEEDEQQQQQQQQEG